MPTVYNQAKTDFYNKYKTNIDGLAKTNNVDTGIAQDMLMKNLTSGGQYKGGGVLDYTKASQDANNVISAAGSGTTSTPSVQQAPDYQDQINSIYNQDKASRLAALKAQRDQAGGLINQQKAELAPQYQNMRNQSDVVNAQNVQKLRELMAQNGLTASGDNVTAQVGLANERQNALNSLNTQEQQQVNDYNRRLTDLYNPAQEQSILSQIEAARAQALYNGGIDQRNFNFQQSQADRNNALQLAQLLGMYNGAPTLQRQQMDNQNAQFDKTFGLQVGQTLGNYNGSPTLQKQELDANNAYRQQQLAATYAKMQQTAVRNGKQLPSLNQVDVPTQMAMQQMNDYNNYDEAMQALQDNAGYLNGLGIDVNRVAEYVNAHFGLQDRRRPEA